MMRIRATERGDCFEHMVKRRAHDDCRRLLDGTLAVAVLAGREASRRRPAASKLRKRIMEF